MQKYVDYIKNTGPNGTLKVDQFDDDWEPIGPVVRAKLVANGLIAIGDFGRILVLDAPPPTEQPGGTEG